MPKTFLVWNKRDGVSCPVIVDEEDFEFVKRFKWSLEKGKSTYYAITDIGGKVIRLHQLLLPSEDINITPDHKNGNGLDCRRENLRLANKVQQAQNRSKKAGTLHKYKGVSFRSGRFQARIIVNGKTISLGNFLSQVSAARAYNEAAVKYFGEFAKLNQIEVVN